MNHLTSLIERAQSKKGHTVAVANAADEDTLQTVKLAVDKKLASFVLFGDIEELQNCAKQISLELSHPNIHLVHAIEDAGTKAVQEVRKGNATILMKGNISTKDLLQAVLNKENGLRTNDLLSHVALFDIPGRPSPVLLTDAAINIAPNLFEKVAMIKHAVIVAQTIGIKCPRVAVIAPVDVINEAIPSTLDAAELTNMQERGEIEGCLIGGPISFDNAISPKSAKHKGSLSKVSGVADVLMVPSIEVGNALYKSFIFFAHAKVAGIVCGASAPIVLSSRTDSAESKLYSLALALITAGQ